MKKNITYLSAVYRQPRRGIPHLPRGKPPGRAGAGGSGRGAAYRSSRAVYRARAAVYRRRRHGRRPGAADQRSLTADGVNEGE
jgi:hypothetical protein